MEKVIFTRHPLNPLPSERLVAGPMEGESMLPLNPTMPGLIPRALPVEPEHGINHMARNIICD